MKTKSKVIVFSITIMIIAVVVTLYITAMIECPTDVIHYKDSVGNELAVGDSVTLPETGQTAKISRLDDPDLIFLTTPNNGIVRVSQHMFRKNGWIKMDSNHRVILTSPAAAKGAWLTIIFVVLVIAILIAVDYVLTRILIPEKDNEIDKEG